MTFIRAWCFQNMGQCKQLNSIRNTQMIYRFVHPSGCNVYSCTSSLFPCLIKLFWYVSNKMLSIHLLCALGPICGFLASCTWYMTVAFTSCLRLSSGHFWNHLTFSMQCKHYKLPVLWKAQQCFDTISLFLHWTQYRTITRLRLSTHLVVLLYSTITYSTWFPTPKILWEAFLFSKCTIRISIILI